MADKIVVGEDALFRAPEITLHSGGTGFGAALPALRIIRFAQQKRKVLHVALVAIEQAVEADRCVVMRGAVEGAEAKTGIESGFAHGAIAQVEIPREPVTCKPRTHADDARVHVAAGELEARRFGGIGMLRTFHEKAVAARVRMGNEPAKDVDVVAAIVGLLGNRA